MRADSKRTLRRCAVGALCAALLLLPAPIAPADAAEDAERQLLEAELMPPRSGPPPSPWQLPLPGACAPRDGLRGRPLDRDASGAPFQPGDAFGIERLQALEDFLPPELWAQRERFFYEGMRLVIGDCFADYGPPEFYRAATAAFAGRTRLLGNGGIADHVAGAPFPAQTIEPRDPQAGLMWAWNLELRYQGAGFRGPFRTSDMVGRVARAEPFEGEIFKLQLAFRADRAEAGYRASGARNKHWVAGGTFSAPFAARQYAWRQFRDVEHTSLEERSDDLHAYLPDWRRVRRLSASGVEGIFMPSFSVGVVKPQTGGGAGSGGAAGQVAAVSAPASITTKRSGFEGLELRPLLYDFRVLAVRDVLTPINASTPAYPKDGERDFGPWGLSFASDRWDLRRSIVLEGRAKRRAGGDRAARLVLYLDAQTYQPLYYASYDSRDEPIDVGIFAGRWSEERRDYPRWPDDPERPVRLIDPVGAAFANVREGGGWRRESWTMISTPPDDRSVRRLISVADLAKQR